MVRIHRSNCSAVRVAEAFFSAEIVECGVQNKQRSES